MRTLLDAKAGIRGAIRSRKGDIRLFRRRGVADLFELVSREPDFMSGAEAADKVIGRGAALLLVKGGVASVYAEVISSGALRVLRDAGISVSFGTETPHIVNREGTGMCPVERLTGGTSDPDEAFILIKRFIEQNQNR